jgi:hypothetical protein
LMRHLAKLILPKGWYAIAAVYASLPLAEALLVRCNIVGVETLWKQHRRYDLDI